MATGPFELAEQLEHIGWLCGIAHAKAVNHVISWDSPEADVRSYQPAVRHANFGSPLSLLVEVPAPLLGGIASMSLLIYGVKRIWGLPLEFKTHREEQLGRFREAAIIADEAEMRLEEIQYRRIHSVVEGEREEPSQPEGEEPGSQYQHASSSAIRFREAEGQYQAEIQDMAEDLDWDPSGINRIARMRATEWESGSATWFLDDE